MLSLKPARNVKMVMDKYILILLLAFTGCVQANDIIVSLRDGVCHATFADKDYRCSLGRHGLTSNKSEGDGKTPIGDFPLRAVFVRPDKIYKDNLRYVSLPVNYISPDDGWCDDPVDQNYNQHVSLAMLEPHISHESLFRDDDLYDFVIVVGYNDAPVKPGKGSAIFIHVASNKYAGTSGCIALSARDIVQILPLLNEESRLIVKG